MAENAGVSPSTVGRIWRTFGLQPHVVESFKISDDHRKKLQCRALVLVSLAISRQRPELCERISPGEAILKQL